MPLGQYFEGLCQEVLEATGAKNVVCLVEVPPVTFDINRLTMSLLLNEAITNSVKHGLGGRERGTISIRLDLDIANRYALTIKDDGNGLESGTIQRKGLGSSIMQSLAAQLRGEITFVTGGRGDGDARRVPRRRLGSYVRFWHLADIDMSANDPIEAMDK